MQKALELIQQKQEKIILLSNNNCHHNLLIFLNSLNKSFYDYLIFTTNTYTDICYFNQYFNESDLKKDFDFIDAVKQILLFYEKFYCGKVYRNKHIYRVCEYIRLHLSDDLSLETVASKMYINKCYLCHLFTSNLNINFSDYVCKERICLAKKLLLNQNFSIELISNKCGFSSCSYFSRVFKKITNFSPSQYRKLIQNKTIPRLTK